MITERKRAGFRRRVVSCCVDYIIVFLPIQIIAAILFALTAGFVQFTNGVIYTTRCEPVSQILQNILPPPPANATEIQNCHVYWFGAQTGRRLIVKRATKDGNTTKNISQEYTLDKKGNPIHGFPLEWVAYIALISYFIWAKARTGATQGDRAIGIEVIDATSSDNSPPPFNKLIVRYLALAGPLALGSTFDAYGSTIFADDELGTLSTVGWSLIGVLYFGFYLICLIQIIMKRDPLYDRIAGTAIIRKTTSSFPA